MRITTKMSLGNVVLKMGAETAFGSFTVQQPSIVWSTFSDLQALIDAADSGDTIDLGGAYYYPGEAQTALAGFVDIEKNITITNGNICLVDGDAVWQDEGDGVYSCSVSIETAGASIIENPMFYIVDFNATEHPRLATYPKPQTASLNEGYEDLVIDLDPYRISRHIDAWLPSDVSETGGTVETFIISGSTKTAFEAVYEADQTDFLLIAAKSNFVKPAEITNYNSGTGVVSVTTDAEFQSDGRILFSLTGKPLVQSEGEYAFNKEEKRVYYKPFNGDITGSFPPKGHNGVRVVDGISASYNVTIDQCNFYGGLILSGTGTQLNMGEYSTVTVTDCSFSHGASVGCGGYGTVQGCSFDWFITRCLSIDDGSTVEDCTIKNTEISGLCFVTQGRSQSLRKTIIKRNYFFMPATTHGNAIAAYEATQQNMEIVENIFHDCLFGIATSARSETDNGGDAVSFIVENNLFIANRVGKVMSAGHGIFSYRDDQGIGDQNCLFVFRNNSLVCNDDLWFQDSRQSDSSYCLQYMSPSFSAIDGAQQNIVRIENNLCAIVNAPVNNYIDLDSDGTPDTTNHWHKNNAVFDTTHSPFGGHDGYSTFNVIVTTSAEPFTDMQSIWDFTDNTSSADSTIGIQWSSVPTYSQLLEIETYWANTYTPQALGELDPIDESDRVTR
jgi:hypothetical protein